MAARAQAINVEKWPDDVPCDVLRKNPDGSYDVTKPITRFFVTHTVHGTMVRAAERDGEFIACFAAERPRLHKSDVMRVRGPAAAHQARLLHYEPKVIPVAIAARRRYREHALIDADSISAGFICLVRLVTASAETLRTRAVQNCSAFGRQELG